MWQDVILMIGGFIFTIALLPSIFSKNKPDWKTSAMTAAVLANYCAVYISLHLWLGLISGLCTTICWFILLYQKVRKMTHHD